MIFRLFFFFVPAQVGLVPSCGGSADSWSTPRGGAVTIGARPHWCVAADVIRSIGPADSRHRSACLPHFYYSYHSQAVGAVMTRRPALPRLEQSAGAMTGVHTHTHTHTQ